MPFSTFAAGTSQLETVLRDWVCYNFWLSLPEPKARTQRLFNLIAPTYARRTLSRTQAQTRQDAQWINPQGHERVLDLACGPGVLGLEMAQRAQEIYGFDLADGMIAQACRAAQTRRCLNTHFGVADGECLPLPAASFDLVTCRYSFANFLAPQQVVQEMHRVTRPGGRIAVLEVVAPENPVRRQELNRLERLRSRIPTRILCLSDLLALFYHASFHLLDAHVERLRQPLGDWLALGDCGVDRRRRNQLREALLRTARKNDPGLLLWRQSGRWFVYHTVARLLWRK